jgi:hypothetical protein
MAGVIVLVSVSLSRAYRENAEEYEIREGRRI